MPGIFIGNTLIKNRLQNWSSYWAPLPDALFDTRNNLVITDSVGGKTMNIEKFPHLQLASNTTTERWNSNHANAASTDWTVLFTLKGLASKTTNNYCKIEWINGVAANYILISINASGYLVFTLYIDGAVRGGSTVISYVPNDNFFGDFRLFGVTYDNAAQSIKRIFLLTNDTVNLGFTPVQNTLGFQIQTSSLRYMEISMIMSYTRKISDAEIAACQAGNFPSDGLQYFHLFNNNARNVFRGYAENVFDGVGGIQSTMYTGHALTVFSYKNTNTLFSPHSLYKGFTQRDTHQIPYLPSGVKNVSNNPIDVECSASGVIHNLAESYINGNPSNHSMNWAVDADKIYALFDKSNRTIWKASIETANLGEHYRQDDNGNYTLWHPLDELNENFINEHAQAGHNGHILVGLRTSGINVTGITKIAVFKENLT